MSRRFYVTTPIYYATARPHLGSLYSTVLADVTSRWHKLKGVQTFFLTGTDEHGQKIAQAAQDAGKEPKEFLEQFIPAYKKTWETYHIDYTDFIRTTDPHHIAGVQAFIKTLLQNDALYTSVYEGWYCTPCETFVTEKEVTGAQPTCPSCRRETHKVSEQTYFFRLSAYQDSLLQFYKDYPDFIVPKERLNEVVSFVESGLHDLSISRTAVRWGVPFPDDPDHTVYVWLDALCNYITAVGYGDPKKHAEFEKWWPVDLHVMAKDIVRFHAVYWPAFLMAAGLKPPRKLLVHGWIKIDQQKMSKSLGNIVDPMELEQEYGPEEIRYYLTRHMSLSQDSDFSIADLEQRLTSDLANDLGNLLQRTVTLAVKNNLTEVAPSQIWSSDALALRDEGWNMLEDVAQAMDDYEFHHALARVWKFINAVNAYFHEREPWKVAKRDQEEFARIISAVSHSLRMIAIILWPVMPYKMTELLKRLGAPFALNGDLLTQLELDQWRHTFTLTAGEALFKKFELVSVARAPIQKKFEKKEAAPLAEDTGYVTIDDFSKVDLRAGTVTSCEPVERSEKLFKMTVDFGVEGTRQVLAGTRAFYTPEQLIGTQNVFVFNLKPRKLLGLESQGMMLMAENAQGKLERVTLSGVVPNGTRLR